METPTSTKKDHHPAVDRKPATANGGRTRLEVSVDRIFPDANNRPIDEGEEEFLSLLESVRLFRVLSPLHVRQEGDTYQLIDGERRWRAAKIIGLHQVPCEVWPASATRSDAVAAGIVLNEQRRAHSCIQVARRLRELLHADGLSREQLASRMGIALDRVKAYLQLFDGTSEFLLKFLETNCVPLWVAAELVRYERATNEARSRRLIERYRNTPLTREQLIQLRKKDGTGRRSTDTGSAPAATAKYRPFSSRIERAYGADPKAALAELEEVLGRLGLRVVAEAQAEISTR